MKAKHQIIIKKEHIQTDRKRKRTLLRKQHKTRTQTNEIEIDDEDETAKGYYKNMAQISLLLISRYNNGRTGDNSSTHRHIFTHYYSHAIAQAQA